MTFHLPNQTLLIQVNGERMIRWHADVQPQIELIASDQQRIFDVSLHDSVRIVAQVTETLQQISGTLYSNEIKLSS